MIKQPISVIVKDPEWQAIRRSLLGQWIKNPRGCCDKLKRYIIPLHSVSNDRLRIVMNYLTGTAFRIGRIKHPCITQIRKSISLEIGVRKMHGKWY